jgi:lipoprotein NlpI
MSQVMSGRFKILLAGFAPTLVLVSLLSLPSAAQEKDAENHLREAVRLYFEAKPKESVAEFDKVIELEPKAAPQLWQRGLALYYAEDFKEGRRQFELHRTVNPDDVENAAWHFLCVARADGVEAARKALIPMEGDARIPMKEVYELFGGKGSEEAVLKAANAGDPTSEEHRNQLCYAHLYLGLYYEALGQTEKAKDHMLKAAQNFRMDHYMGRTAQVHVKLRGWDKEK